MSPSTVVTLSDELASVVVEVPVFFAVVAVDAHVGVARAEVAHDAAVTEHVAAHVSRGVTEVGHGSAPPTRRALRPRPHYPHRLRLQHHPLHPLQVLHSHRRPADPLLPACRMTVPAGGPLPLGPVAALSVRCVATHAELAWTGAETRAMWKAAAVMTYRHQLSYS